MNFPKFFIPSISDSTANPDCVFTFPTLRFSLLTNRIVRVEISPEGTFEDRPTQTFWYRNQKIPDVKINYTNSSLFIETDTFLLNYIEEKSGTHENFEFILKETGRCIRLDEINPGIFPGTTRTLDETNGPITLQYGFLSRDGWVQLDDTSSLIFNDNGWLETRPDQPGYRDLYFLFSGTNYRAALKDYQRIAGFPPLLPRAFLGNWWSRFWEYSQQDIQQLVQKFADEELPFSVFIIDMDWHITQTGNKCSGWTGFSWNRVLFPDPSALIKWLHEKNLITSLNLHPAEGIHAHEDRYPAAANGLGLDPSTKTPIPFDIANPRIAEVYFNEVLRPLEEDGVDFWWLDWQQGDRSSMPNLDPLWWLNHLHFYDLAKSTHKRPVIFSRWGGPGNHRYPIGFSGDTVVTWKSLAYQPFFTASAANAAYGWWSHDIGGHMFGKEDAELYTRWVQFGVLSPIFRLHCTKNPFVDRAPWSFDAETLRITRQAMQLRHALVPYLYTLSRINQLEGQPPITPLYYDYPQMNSAYEAKDQYMLGSQLLAAPIIQPIDPDLHLSVKNIWFPPGVWFDFFTGEKIIGDSQRNKTYRLDEIPLFAKAGTILPLQADVTQNGCANPKSFDILVFPGADGSFDLYEDDGNSQNYLQKGGCITKFITHSSDTTLYLQIEPSEGDTLVIPQTRSWHIQIRGINTPKQVVAVKDGKKITAEYIYDKKQRTCSIMPIELGITQTLWVEVQANQSDLLAQPPTFEESVMRILHDASMETDSKWRIMILIPVLLQDPTKLQHRRIKLTKNQRLALQELIQEFTVQP